MSWLQNLKKSPLTEIGRWGDMRWPWILCIALCCGLVLVAHNVFQVWLYMPPCEQCVYIRYAFLVTAIGALVIAINPKQLALKAAGTVIALYGSIFGILCSTKLAHIHHAVHSEDMADVFGMQGCSTEPHYPFGLPLEKWAPSWFQPTGDCGYDLAVVPDGTELSSLQQWFIELYNSSDSWYLIPPAKFMSMADCCLLAFSVAAILIALLSGASLWNRFKKH